MSKFISRKRILCIVSLMVPCLQAYAKPLPTLPPGQVPTAPYHIVSKHATLAPQVGGISPAQMRTAYGYPANFLGAGETIAIVDANDDPNIESDLATFNAQFGLPACTSANGCFTKAFSDGSQPSPDPNWAVEISLDVEWAHAMAPQAKILLIETQSPDTLYNGVAYAIALKPSVISLSWGQGEWPQETEFDSFFQASTVPIFAASGDGGHGVWYPASSPYVVGVGATQISIDSNGNYISESAWSGSGGGVSAYETEPAFQSNYVIAEANGMRGEPDVSYVGSTGSPFAVYDSYSQGGWLLIAGTSAGTPQWAALVADMKAAKNGNFAIFNQSIYSVARQTNPVLLNTISTGSNGSCGYYCNARSGYNYTTGLGTPMSSMLINRFD
jgi:subtilase family serine protease